MTHKCHPKTDSINVTYKCHPEMDSINGAYKCIRDIQYKCDL